MDNVIKKCPKDGSEREAGSPGNCQTCSGPLDYYCRVHNEWLVDATCNRCARAAAATLAPAPTAGSKSIWAVLFVIALIALFAGSVATIYVVVSHTMHPSPKNAEAPTDRTPPISVVVLPTPAPAPAATHPVAVPREMATPKPTERTAPAAVSFPNYPPLSLSVNQILIDPEKYLEKLIRTSGAVQVKETEKESFDLRAGDFTLPVLYRLLTPEAKAAILSTPLGRPVTVTGLLRHDETDNSYYVLAQQVDTR